MMEIHLEVIFALIEGTFYSCRVIENYFNTEACTLKFYSKLLLISPDAPDNRIL